MLYDVHTSSYDPMFILCMLCGPLVVVTVFVAMWQRWQVTELAGVGFNEIKKEI